MSPPFVFGLSVMRDAARRESSAISGRSPPSSVKSSCRPVAAHPLLELGEVSGFVAHAR